MRKNIAVAVAIGSIIISLFLGLKGIRSWAWGSEFTATTWIFAGAWLAGFKLNQSHSQLVAREANVFTRMSGLAKQMFDGGILLTVIAIALHLAGK